MDQGEAVKRRRNLLTLSGILVLASLGCSGLVLVRYFLTDRLAHSYLLWNLFLAWMPYLISLFLIPAGRLRGKAGKRVAVSLVCAAWLVFYPNSPYIFTDMIHVVNKSFLNTGGSEWLTKNSLLWYDLIQTSTFAFVGHFIGLISLSLVHESISRAWNRATGWIVSGLAVALSGLGIYLGRFVRLNSWDLLIDPVHVLARAGKSAFTVRALLFSAAFSFFIASTYLMLHIFRRVDLGDRDN
jgi:uncharacterized membrane protein